MNKNRDETSAATPLARSSLKVVITDLLAEYELRHVFRNEGDGPIEAIYSFPVPLDAAFGGMDARLAGRTLSSEVLPARQATQQYDGALAEGDSAVLLEQVQAGMLCISLGNLKPGEEGEVVLRFSAALGVADGVARFSLPLVHRPRYGRSPLEEFVEPVSNFAVEHPLSADVRLSGMLAARPVRCLTHHDLRFAVQDGEPVLRLDDAMLDRDLVLEIDLGQEPDSTTRWIADGEGSIGMLTFMVPCLEQIEPAPRDVCLVLDCSGSMAGDAIGQSRKALAAVTDALGHGDRVQVIRFGDSNERFFRRPLPATPQVKQALAELATVIGADRGGTNLSEAIQEALRTLNALEGDKHRKVVILVTDGAVQAHMIRKAQQEAQSLGIRVFVVAVGSSAAAEVLGPLAESTGGTMERAVPAEPIDVAVMRQFRRARSLPVAMEVDWGGQDAQPLPLRVTYPGDAVTVVAMFPDQRPREIEVRIPALNDRIGSVLDTLETHPGWRSWAGQQAYGHLPTRSSERESLALRYGLIAQETMAVLVSPRAAHDKVDGLPTIMPVAHMVPKGMVSASQSASASQSDPMDVRYRLDLDMAVLRSGSSHQSPPDFGGMSDFDAPAFLRRYAGGSTSQRIPVVLGAAAEAAVIEALIDLLSNEDGSFSADDLLRNMEPGYQNEVRAWLKDRSLNTIDQRDGLSLLRELLSDGVGQRPMLDDEYEARLAILLMVS